MHAQSCGWASSSSSSAAAPGPPLHARRLRKSSCCWRAFFYALPKHRLYIIHLTHNGNKTIFSTLIIVARRGWRDPLVRCVRRVSASADVRCECSFVIFQSAARQSESSLFCAALPSERSEKFNRFRHTIVEYGQWQPNGCSMRTASQCRCLGGGAGEVFEWVG